MENNIDKPEEADREGIAIAAIPVAEGSPRRIMTLGPKRDTPDKRLHRIDRRKWRGNWKYDGVCPTSGPCTVIIFADSGKSS